MRLIVSPRTRGRTVPTAESWRTSMSQRNTHRSTSTADSRAALAGRGETEIALAAARDVCRLSAKSRQAELNFLLQRVAGGLYVEREDLPRRGMHNAQTISFTSAADFHRWCDRDRVRFEHPLLHCQLKRSGDRLWRIEPRSA